MKYIVSKVLKGSIQGTHPVVGEAFKRSEYSMGRFEIFLLLLSRSIKIVGSLGIKDKIRKLLCNTLGNGMFVFVVIVIFIGTSVDAPWFYYLFVLLLNLLIALVIFVFQNVFGEKIDWTLTIKRNKKNENTWIEYSGGIDAIIHSFNILTGTLFDECDPKKLDEMEESLRAIVEFKRELKEHKLSKNK